MRKLSISCAVVLFAALPVSGGEPRPAPNWSTTATAWDSGDYQYDGAGNISRIGDDVYTYDALGRLTYATAKSPVSSDDLQQYEYDSYGNLKRVTTTSTGGAEFVEAFRVNRSTNQLNGEAADCVAPYDVCFMGEYDGAGRQTGILPNENRYEWTPLGEMKGVNLSSRREQYIYDANGERIVTIDLDTGERNFTLRNSANQVVREISDDPSAQWTWKRDWVYRGDKLIAGFVAGEAGAGPHLHYHPDHLGTPRLITDAAGYKQRIHAYWPFGEEAPGNERDTTERMKFTGHERDSSRDPNAIGHDLYYMHARFYTPAMARFLFPDPVLDADAALGSPQMWNRYAYVADNPLNRVDPDGRELQFLDGDYTRQQAFDEFKKKFAPAAQKHLTMDAKGYVRLTGISKADFGAKYGASAGKYAEMITQVGHTSTVKLIDSTFARLGGGARTESSGNISRIEINPYLFKTKLGGAMMGGVLETIQSSMAHELLGHAYPYEFNVDNVDPAKYGWMRNPLIPKEAYAIWAENQWRAENGLPARLYHVAPKDYNHP